MKTLRHVALDVPVRAPSAYTNASIPVYFRDRELGRDPANVALSFPLDRFAGGLSIHKNVTIVLRYVPSTTAAKAVEIAWSTPDSTAFPRFLGTFETKAESPQTCSLHLTGDYAAPGGIAGRIFDSILGYRIATASIVGFLRDVSRSIEERYTIQLAMS